MGVHLFGPLYRASILRAPPGAKGCLLVAFAQPVGSHRFPFGQHSRASAVYVLSGSQRQPTHPSQYERKGIASRRTGVRRGGRGCCPASLGVRWDFVHGRRRPYMDGVGGRSHGARPLNRRGGSGRLRASLSHSFFGSLRRFRSLDTERYLHAATAPAIDPFT